MNVNSPFPKGLVDECDKCAGIIAKFVSVRPEEAPLLEMAKKNEYTKEAAKYIPRDVVKNCKGIAVLTVVKAGAAITARAGSGLVVAKLESGEWSAPSAIGIAGLGVGWQFGAEITDYVFILNTEAAVAAFHSPNFTLGGHISVAAGPYGRAGEASASVMKLAPIYSYSFSKGLYIGVSVEGSVILERADANAEFYHERVSAKSILCGCI